MLRSFYPIPTETLVGFELEFHHLTLDLTVSRTILQCSHEVMDKNVQSWGRDFLMVNILYKTILCASDMKIFCPENLVADKGERIHWDKKVDFRGLALISVLQRNRTNCVCVYKIRNWLP